MGDMPEECFPFPQQLPQKVENSALYGLLPGAGGLLTGTRSGMPGIFFYLQLLYRGHFSS